MTDFLTLQESLLGRYALERELGRGGMGVVWLARDIRLDRLVALKVLRPELARDPRARARFVTEARLAARLAHPHVVPVFAVDADHDPPFMVMALIDGESVATRLATRGALPASHVERMVREMGWALGYAHAAGVIHRDITAANVMIEHATGRTLLTDFGLASEIARDDASPVFGTPGYLAPEIIRGGPSDPRSDLYALGVVAYTALAGRPPFVAESTGELLARHLVALPPPLAPLAPDAPRQLVTAIESCLAKEAGERPADADALLAALSRHSDPIVIAPPLVSWFSRWSRFRLIYAIAAPILGLQTWLLIWGYFGTGSTGLLMAGLMTTAISLTAVPFVAHLLAEAAALQRLRRHGFDIADIRAAWSHWTDHLERLRAREGLRPLAGRVIFDLTVVGAVALVLTFGVISPLLPTWIDPSEVGSVRGALLSMGSVVYMAVMTGTGIGFISPGIRVAPRGRLRRTLQWLWSTRLAGAVTWLAGMGQQHRIATSSTLHRPTELVLGLAIEEIWRGLPAALRAEIGEDTPRVAGTLRRGAEELRTLALRMREAEAAFPTGDPEQIPLVTARERVESQQRESVATLERIRLQLLRVASERQRTVALTGHLERARELEKEMVLEFAAHREVHHLLQRGGGSSRPRSTSAPTPTPVSV